MLDNYGIRTDLALEATERFTEENVEVRGVEIHEDYNEEKDIRTTVVKITTENGARTMGRPQGSYITIEAPGLSVHDEDYHREISLEIARHLQNVINLERELSILVVGLGNSAITADSLGPHVVENLHITRHMIREYGLQSLGKEKMHRISGIIPGVMAQTGMETSEIIQGIVAETTTISLVRRHAAVRAPRVVTSVLLPSAPMAGAYSTCLPCWISLRVTVSSVRPMLAPWRSVISSTTSSMAVRSSISDTVV